MFCTYILESPGGVWYYGHTNDIDRRLHQHNRDQNKWTKNKGPWRLIFARYFDTKLDANRFELH
jgi:putative endonuclease